MNHEMVRITCGRVSILEEKIILPILLLNFSSDSWISVSLFFFFFSKDMLTVLRQGQMLPLPPYRTLELCFLSICV